MNNLWNEGELAVADRVMIRNLGSLIEQLWARVEELEGTYSMSARTSNRAVVASLENIRARLGE